MPLSPALPRVSQTTHDSSVTLRHACSALGNGTISIADIDERIRMQFRMRLRLGHFDPIGPLDAISEAEAVCSDYAIATSMAGAVQSCALLKNANASTGGTDDDDTAQKRRLPLDPTKVGTVAVLGPLAEYSEATTGYYGPHDCCGAHEKKGYWTLVDAVKRYAPKPGQVLTAAGVPKATKDER